MLPQTRKRVVYSDQYREELFWLWYNQGCPPVQEFMESVPLHRGELPEYQSVIRWKRENEWDQRAKNLDTEVVRQVEEDTINARVEMLKRHAEAGEGLLEAGLEFLRENGITEQRSAINAIKVGAAIEAASRGIPDALLKVPKMSDKQIAGIIRQLGDGLSPKEMKLFEAQEYDVEGEFHEVEENDESG